MTVSERTVTEHLVIQELCRELHMSEDRLLCHLALNSAPNTLSKRGVKVVVRKARIYHEQGVYTVKVRHGWQK